MLCCISCLPGPHTPIHKGIHNSGASAKGARPTVVEAAEGRLLYGWMGVWELGRPLRQQSIHKYVPIYPKCVYSYIICAHPAGV